MARGGNRGTKGGGVSVNPSTTNIANNRYGGGFGGFGQAPQPQAEPQPAYESMPTGIVAGGPNPYGAGNDLGASADRIISDMRYNHNIGGYQGLPQQRAFQQPQPFRPQFEPMRRYGSPMYSAPYQPRPMPFRAPSPGKGGSKGGGMSVPKYPSGPGSTDPFQFPYGTDFRMETQPYLPPIQENPLGNRGGMMRTGEMRPGRDYTPFRPPARQMQFMQAQPSYTRPQSLQQQAALQGLGGFFR